MKTRSVRLFAFAIIAAATLGTLGCQNKAKLKSVPETPRVEAETPKPPPSAEVTPPVAEPFPRTDVDKTNVVEPTIDELNRQGVLRTVYFGYNSNEIDDDAKATLQANAAWLRAHAKYTIEIGGHCDERGSIGYNVALGDRRASAVKDYVTGLGVGAGQLVAISYGEEKPADPGHDEAAWAKNRRAEFTIKP
jgi:peptidoglycan-associated lipoprotein